MKKTTITIGVLALAGAGIAYASLHQPAALAQAKAATSPQAGSARPLLITGVVDAIDSQAIQVPPSNSSPVVLRNFVEEGTVVKRGDVVLRIDSAEAASIAQLKIDSEQAAATAAKETADLEVKAVEAERALAEASAALAKARVDAALPRSQISGLDFDRYQGERERALRDLDVKKQASTTASEAVARRRADAELQARQRQILIDFNTARQELVKVRAVRDGVVVHGYSEWRGERYDEGSSAFPGNSVGQVMGTGGMRVQAWAAEADRPFVSANQAVRLSFDALPNATLEGKITAIASAPAARAIWGSARYFKLDIALPADQPLPLVAGMSVLVEPLKARPALPVAPVSANEELKIEGEIATRGAISIAPPSIPDVWQYQLAQLAPEGALIKAGALMATFDANTVSTQMESRQAILKEKQSTLAKVKLDHAEAERAGELAVAEAQSNAERAKRKAMQPKELIRRIDYDKLVIERKLGDELAALAIRQRDAQTRARKAEISALVTEVTRQQGAIAVLAKGKESMTIKAPRDGLMVYRTQWGGDKVAVGSQVWMGMAVATLADQNQMIVQAKVPEVQAAGVQLGQRARVTVQGSNSALNATVVTLGRTYHGKSKSQPVVVRDLELEFEAQPRELKPGAAVQVTLLPLKGKAS
ncbi:MAG: HlyD family efflux transporter periplasmic adaptor subunit [Pseudomonadota bacterium]